MRKTQLKRSAPKKTNPARRKREFGRIYGSTARVKWVKSLPCAACGVVGYSENAHIENGGMGRKAAYTKIVPLCGPRMAHPGCHHALHMLGRKQFEDRYLFGSLDILAAKVEELWISSIVEATK